MSIDLPAIDFGAAQMLLLPAEAYVEYQLYAQARRPDPKIEPRSASSGGSMATKLAARTDAAPVVRGVEVDAEPRTEG